MYGPHALYQLSSILSHINLLLHTSPRGYVKINLLAIFNPILNKDIYVLKCSLATTRSVKDEKVGICTIDSRDPRGTLPTCIFFDHD